MSKKTDQLEFFGNGFWSEHFSIVRGHIYDPLKFFKIITKYI